MGLTLVSSFAVLAFIASTAIAQTPNFSCDCNGFEAPDWDDCDTIASTLSELPLEYTVLGPGEPCDALNPPSGVDKNSLNCVVIWCPRPGVVTGTNVTAQDIAINYDTVRSTCKAETGSPGGTCGPIASVPLSINSQVNVTAMANGMFKPSKRHIAAAEPRVPGSYSRDFVKRDGTLPSSDTSFDLVVTSANVQAPGQMFQVFGPAPSGSTYTVMKSHTKTNAVTSTAGLDADLFEIFTGSVSVEFSFSDTIQETKGFSVPVNCSSGQRGVVFWAPLYTFYQGLYEPSGTQDGWYVASGKDQTSYVLQCLD